MSPREDGEMKSGGAPPSPGGDSYSCFWNRLSTIPVIQGTIETTMGIYSSSKETAVIGKGLGYLEYGVGLATTPVMAAATALVEKYPLVTTTATNLDTFACSCLETIENKVPIIQKPPKQIVTTVKKETLSTLHTSVRRVMKTMPGHQLVKTLDALISWSEATLEKQKVDEHEAKKSDGGSSDEEPAKETTKDSLPAMILKSEGVVVLRVYLQLLKLVKHLLANMAGVKTRSASASPRKAVATGRRKKASPKKRLSKKGLINQLAGSAMTMIGLRSPVNVIVDDLCSRLKSSDNVNERNDKRKHDDCADDESDSESLNLASALDSYLSEEDPDYVPGEEQSDDDGDVSTGEEESDLEVEETGRSKKGEPLRQIVDKKVKGIASPSLTSAPPAGALPSPQVVLQPGWKSKPDE